MLLLFSKSDFFPIEVNKKHGFAVSVNGGLFFALSGHSSPADALEEMNVYFENNRERSLQQLICSANGEHSIYRYAGIEYRIE